MPALVPLESFIKDWLNKEEQKVAADSAEVQTSCTDFFLFFS